MQKLILCLVCLCAQAEEASIQQWRDQNGVMHFSDGASNGIKETYETSPTVLSSLKTSTKSRRTARASARDQDDDKRATLTAECEWLRGRIANLRRLTHGNPDSVFNDELQRRQIEWKKTRCESGTHHWNRELLPTRKASKSQ